MKHFDFYVTSFRLLIFSYEFQAPNTYGIMEVFDMFFKVHKIFNLDFHPNIQPMMLFVEKYIFKMNHSQSQLTARIREIALKYEYLFATTNDENGNEPSASDLNDH